jgi:hypothetical protein
MFDFIGKVRNAIFLGTFLEVNKSGETIRHLRVILKEESYEVFLVYQSYGAK